MAEEEDGDKKKKKKSSKYNYSFGDSYPGIQIGHKQCLYIRKGMPVPASMGWLWNATDVPGMKFRRGWTPGAVGKSVAKVMTFKYARGGMEKDKNKKKKKKGNRAGADIGGGDSEPEEPLEPKPALKVQRKGDVFTIQVNPLKDLTEIAPNEDPYVDCDPMVFKIIKKRSPEEQAKVEARKMVKLKKQRDSEIRQALAEAVEDIFGGTTGENMTMSVAERKKIVDAWVAVSKSTGLHIMVQVGGAPLADVLDLARYCQSAGTHSLLTLPELYFRPASVEELVFYVAQVAKAAPKLPVLYYHIPSMSKVEINMPAFVTAATASIPNFKGLKFTCNDLDEGFRVLRSLKSDQAMFLGADTLIAPGALLGIRSSIGTTWNLFPKLAQQILDAVANNDVQKARQLQEKLCLAVEAHTCEGPWVPIMKAGMEIVTGIKVGPPCLPQRPISAEARQRIQTKLRALGLSK